MIIGHMCLSVCWWSQSSLLLPHEIIVAFKLRVLYDLLSKNKCLYGSGLLVVVSIWLMLSLCGKGREKYPCVIHSKKQIVLVLIHKIQTEFLLSYCYAILYPNTFHNNMRVVLLISSC